MKIEYDPQESQRAINLSFKLIHRFPIKLSCNNYDYGLNERSR